MKRIEQMYAFIAEDPAHDNVEGDEGIPAVMDGNGMMIPLVGADWKRIESMRTVAQQVATASGKKLTLCRFEIRTELEVIEP